MFRDQEFSSDERSRPVHRIGEVRTLRTRQFAEDAGPLAHSVRPSQYREINNFYTATVYEKGAEIVRMLKTLIGPDAFARGMTRFFDACDGTAATVEDFLAAFAESGRDLTHFARWYDQAGTPLVTISTAHDPASGIYRLGFEQTTPATPGQAEKTPLAIPVALGLVGAGAVGEDREGRIRSDGVFVLDRASDMLVFEGVGSRPVPSVFRGFSAPVKLRLDLDESDLLTLLRHDTDAFTRWQSGQTVALRLLVGLVGAPGSLSVEAFAGALDAFLEAEAMADPAFAAVVLSVPGEAEIAQEIGQDVDPCAIRAAFDQIRRAIGLRLAERLARAVEVGQERVVGDLIDDRLRLVVSGRHRRRRAHEQRGDERERAHRDITKSPHGDSPVHPAFPQIPVLPRTG